MSTPRYLVAPRARGWILRSGSIPLRMFSTKHQALSAGVRLASGRRPSELVVEGPDGSIDDRRVYAPA